MFYRILCRFLVLKNDRIITNVVDSRITFGSLSNPFSCTIRRFISSRCTISNSPPNQQLLTVDYLVKSCGLSPELSLRAYQHIVAKSPNTTTTTKLDSVLCLFKTYGFTQPHISKLISQQPLLLLSNPDKTLKPKLEYFNSIGISGPILGKIISKNPTILMTSLHNQIIPSINFLMTFLPILGIVSLLNSSRMRGVLLNTESTMGPNIAILRHHGMPESNISKFMRRYPHSISIKSSRFKIMVLELVEIRVDPSSTTFVHTLHVLLSMSRPTWNSKLVLYRSFGLSDYEILSIFKKQPFFMAASVKKIKLVLDFFMNSQNWTRDDVSKDPSIVLLSMEKRIIPRCYVLQILLSKGLINKKSMGGALKLTEDVFLKKFVIKFQDELPELLKTYQSKLST